MTNVGFIGIPILCFCKYFQHFTDFYVKREELVTDTFNYLAWFCPGKLFDDLLIGLMHAAPMAPDTPLSMPMSIILTISRRRSVRRSLATLNALRSFRTTSARDLNSSARATIGDKSNP